MFTRGWRANDSIFCLFLWRVGNERLHVWRMIDHRARGVMAMLLVHVWHHHNLLELCCSRSGPVVLVTTFRRSRSRTRCLGGDNRTRRLRRVLGFECHLEPTALGPEPDAGEYGHDRCEYEVRYQQAHLHRRRPNSSAVGCRAVRVYYHRGAVPAHLLGVRFASRHM